MSKSKYNAPWTPMSVNEEFWTEVFVGRVVTEVLFDVNGIIGLKLDSGETIHLNGAGVAIQD